MPFSGIQCFPRPLRCVSTMFAFPALTLGRGPAPRSRSRYPTKVGQTLFSSILHEPFVSYRSHRSDPRVHFQQSMEGKGLFINIVNHPRMTIHKGSPSSVRRRVCKSASRLRAIGIMYFAGPTKLWTWRKSRQTTGVVPWRIRPKKKSSVCAILLLLALRFVAYRELDLPTVGFQS
jgi:hypothetical protein